LFSPGVPDPFHPPGAVDTHTGKQDTDTAPAVNLGERLHHQVYVRNPPGFFSGSTEMDFPPVMVMMESSGAK
jgi:hypothetical protein